MSTKRTISDLGDENLRPCKRGAPALCTTTAQQPRTPLLPLAAAAPIPAACQLQPQQAACRAAGVPKSDEAGGASPGAAKPARRLPGRLAQPAAPRAELPTLSLAECRVIYVATAVEVEWWATRFLHDPRLAAVALDIEWRVTFKTGEPPRPAALVQLAYRRAAPPAGEPPHTCVLLHVAVAGLTPALRALLQSPRPAKVGVGIHGDALKMQRDWGLEAQGIVDLSEMALERGVSRGSDPGVKWSLADLAERVLKRRLAKLPALRLSDWEAAPLSQAQVSYAALDAFACLQIHQALKQLPILQSVLDARAAAAAAAAAAQALGANAIAAPTAAAADDGDVVPAVPMPQRLQPAKQAVCAAFHEQGMSIAAVAELKRIQPSTVSSYLAEAVLGGHAYSWRRFGVPDAALAAVKEAAAAVLLPAPCSPNAGTGAPAAAALAAAPAASAPPAAATPLALAASAAAAVWATGVFADASDDSEDEALLAAMLAEPAVGAAQHDPACMRGGGPTDEIAQQPLALQPATAAFSAACSAAASAPAAAATAGAAQAAAAAGPGATSHAAQQATALAAAPVDLAAMLSAAGVGTRAFKERLTVDVDYGHIRLALAHLGRTSTRFAVAALSQEH